MLYKYLFYGISYIIKKYDRFWQVGDIYYAWGSIMIGMTIGIIILSIMDIIGILIFFPMIWQQYKILAYLPFAFSVISTVFFGHKKRHERIYDEVANWAIKKKKKYKRLSILYLIAVFGVYFMLGDIARGLNGGSVPSYAEYIIENWLDR